MLSFASLLVANLIGTSCADTVTYYYTNQQGTPLATADEAGNILSTTDYRSFGVQALGNPSAAPGYTSHLTDPDSGLTYMQARYYDASIGRFLSIDPEPAGPGFTFLFGKYSYAANNPIGNVDPDGRQSVPLEAYTRYWPGSEQEKQSNFINGMAGTLVSIATQSNVFDNASAGSGSGAIASSGLPGEFLLGAAITKTPGMVTSLMRQAPEIASESGVAALPRMRVMDSTAPGAGQKDYRLNWTQAQFEDHLSDNGYTMEKLGPVSGWFDQSGAKVFTTRSFSNTGGPTGELFQSGQKSAVAKFRFDQSLNP